MSDEGGTFAGNHGRVLADAPFGHNIVASEFMLRVGYMHLAKKQSPDGSAGRSLTGCRDSSY